MKRIICLLMATVLLFALFTGCGNVTENKENKFSVVTTIFPIYDWIKDIVGDDDNTEVTMLLDSGVDLHSFQPTAEDIVKISNCDVFIYVGGESDKWVTDALKTSVNKDMIAINLMEKLGSSAKKEEIVEGMQAEETEESEEEEAYDEHIWLSLKNASILGEVICNTLCETNPDNTQKYKENLNVFNNQVLELDNEYYEMVNNATRKTIVFGDRFPFRYLVDDYHLNYYAAFVGCSAETEASFETITFLTSKIDELNLNVILTLEGSKTRIAETIIKNSSNKNLTTGVMNSMQSITKEDVNNGVDYFSVMKENLQVLKTALA